MELLHRLPTQHSASGKVRSMGLFLCSFCSAQVERRVSDGLKVKSCGCARKQLISVSHVRHGGSCRHQRDRLYQIWCAVLRRCRDKSNKHYGGRGISVCQEWHSYEGFKAWAEGAWYDDSLEIDRIDNAEGYSPDNCRWVSRTENIHNSEATKLTAEQVQCIRAEYVPGVTTYKSIGYKYGVGLSAVHRIIKGQTWR